MSRDDNGDVTLKCKIGPEVTFDRGVTHDCAAYAEIA
jgi:hypothetical protein